MGEKVCYEENGVKLTFVGVKGDIPDNSYYNCYFYIENSTDESVSLSVKAVKINGVDCSSSASIFASGGSVNYGEYPFPMMISKLQEHYLPRILSPWSLRWIWSLMLREAASAEELTTSSQLFKAEIR